MSQTVVLEQQSVATQSITLKLDASSSTGNPNNPAGDSKPEPENDQSNDHVIPIPNVDTQTEAAVNAFLRRRGSTDEEVRTEAMNDLRRFVEEQEIGTLLFLSKFAVELNDSELKDVVCGRVAEMITHKTVEEVRTIFNIENDFTPEEEQAVRDENPWAFGE